MTEPSTPAGWYPDPDGSPVQRYWDGTEWTEHRTPHATAGHARHAKDEPEPGAIKGPVWAWLAGGAAAVVAVIVALVLVFTNMDTGVKHSPSADKTSSGASASPSEPTSAHAQQSAAVGEQVRDGAFAFVVTGVDRTAEIADAEYPDDIKKQAHGEFLIVNMKVTNVGDAPQSFFSSVNKLTAGGTTYDADDEAWVYLGNTVVNLNPGDSIDTSVVFDVPVGTQPQSIELHDSPFSSGVAVAF